MFRYSRLFIVFVAFGFTMRGAHAPPKPDTKPNYSSEASVTEQTSTRIAFENDGTRESSARIRIQSDAGVQRYGLLLFVSEFNREFGH
jgi:hypothetical protein